MTNIGTKTVACDTIGSNTDERQDLSSDGDRKECIFFNRTEISLEQSC